jgi:non-specific serine/threonine protein kinase
MPGQGKRPVYEAGGWGVDLARRELRARGSAVPLGSRAFAILEVLVESAGKPVDKKNLVRRVWPGVIVAENTLQVHMHALREAFGSDREMLQTVSRLGYRLAGDWAIRGTGISSDPVPLEQPAIPARPFQANFPMAAPNLIGRASAVRQLRDVVSAYRTVTLTGPGVIGKTALALELARGMSAAVAGRRCRASGAARSCQASLHWTGAPWDFSGQGRAFQYVRFLFGAGQGESRWRVPGGGAWRN